MTTIFSKKQQKYAKEKQAFLLYFSRLSDTLASPKILRLGNKKKSKLSFCISLDFPYLCRVKPKTITL